MISFAIACGGISNFDGFFPVLIEECTGKYFFVLHF